MTRKSGKHWRTDHCSLCGKKHSFYSGKYDKDGIEYVVCGITHKRINVNTTHSNWEDEMKESNNPTEKMTDKSRRFFS